MELFNRKKNETEKNRFKIFNYIPHIILIIILISSIILVFFYKNIIIENIENIIEKIKSYRNQVDDTGYSNDHDKQ